MLDRSKMTVFLCCVLLSACANLVPEAGTPASVGPISPPVAATPAIQCVPLPGRDSDVLAWLTSYRIWLKASADEQRKEYQAAQSAFAKEPGESSRLRLALMLSLPATPWHDEGRLIGLLETSANLSKATDSPTGKLSFLLYRQALERQTLRDELRKQETELLEGQRRIDELQLKLDALRRIDKDIKQRKRTQEGNP